MKMMVLSLLFLLLSIFAPCQTLFRSVQITGTEHLIIDGNIFDNPTVTKVVNGRITWSEPLFASYHCQLEALPSQFKWMITISEGHRRVYVYFGLDGMLLTEETTVYSYWLVSPFGCTSIPETCD